MGANIEGGISFSQVNGHLKVVAGMNCAKTFLDDGAIEVNKGTGNVNIVGADVIASDVLVKEQKGNVNVKNAAVSDVTISLLDGNALLEDLKVDSDASFSDVTGTVNVRGSTFEGDMKVENNNIVKLHGNNFGLEDVIVHGNKGKVTITKNIDFSIVLSENNGVAFHENNARVVEINKNKNFVKINKNTVLSMFCSDNTPPPTGSGNTVEVSSSGQCAGF